MNRREFLRVLPGAMAAALGSMAAGVAVAKEEETAGLEMVTVSHSVEMVDYERLANAVLDAPLETASGGYLGFGAESAPYLRELMEIREKLNWK